VESHVRCARFGVIPNGFKSNRFCRVEKKNRIIAVSRFLERKGIQYLIQAVMDADLQWEIVIVGDGPYMNKLKQMANASKSKIRFTGWLDKESDELQRLYETSSIFILPSESENFPICLLEAMLSRNAIITTRGTGCEEVVGSTAWLVSPKDSGAIRKALKEIIKNEELRSRMGELAYDRARRLFDWPIVAKKYRRLYRRCVNCK
jgi:glycosyltransferase involved in cell wall biosynthesis